MKRICMVLIIIFSLTFSGCSAGSNNYNVKLNDDYSIIKSSETSVAICKKESNGCWHNLTSDGIVVEAGCSDKYIVAKQLGLKKGAFSRTIADKSKESYWIIDVDLNIVNGPLSMTEFNKMLDEMSLDNLELKSIEEYQ